MALHRHFECDVTHSCVTLTADAVDPINEHGHMFPKYH